MGRFVSFGLYSMNRKLTETEMVRIPVAKLNSDL